MSEFENKLLGIIGDSESYAAQNLINHARRGGSSHFLEKRRNMNCEQQ